MKIKKLNAMLSIVVALLIFQFQVHAIGNENNYAELYGVNGNISFSIAENSPVSFFSTLESDSSITYGENYAKITSNSDTITINLNLDDDMYLERMSDLPTEKDVILIKNNEGRIVGVVGIPKSTLDNGNTILGNNIISDNKVISKVYSSENGGISTYVYTQRSFSYYFSAGNYGYRYYEELGKDGGNFWMNPIAHNFIADQDRHLEVLAMSWDATDAYFRTFTGSDYTKWVNNNSKLYNQFKCHYEYSNKIDQWNLEEWRPNISYSQVVLNKCNPY